jgi:hypothetical protein
LSIVTDNENGSAILQAGNVVILATDAFLADGARVLATSAVFRSTVHAMTVLSHLDKSSRPD